MLISSLRNMVIPRLFFNSMFDTMSKFILDMDKDKFEVLLNFANDHITEMAEETKRRTNGMGSMGKRNCDNIAINIMKQKCIELYYDDCKHLIKSLDNDGSDCGATAKCTDI